MAEKSTRSSEVRMTSEDVDKINAACGWILFMAGWSENAKPGDKIIVEDGPCTTIHEYLGEDDDDYGIQAGG